LWHRWRHLAAALAATALIVGSVGGPAIAAAKTVAPAGVTVEITVTNLRNAKGTVWACMTAEPEAFPKCKNDDASYRASAPAHDTIELRFDDVRPGTYAIALLHDENGNGKADRALGMMPKEGFGFSRDARVRMGPPSFDDAVFDFDGTGAALTIRMRYML